ncbi:BamA/TamA family outer membrane protein [Sulfitobacter sp. G21635-S1]|nr:BamA/TamA family outer membrane protein [Sulfitobacter sp. G21635-S1]
MPSLLPSGASRASFSTVLAGLSPAVAMVLAMIPGSVADAQVVRNVEVRGAQFIPEDDIRRTCGAESGVEYSRWELLAIEDCLMSTGVFETVALSREGDTLVIDVQELDTRPGRIDASIAYVSQDGLTASLAYERYNLFDRTYGAFSLEYSKEIQRYSANLYRTEVFESGLDLGFELVGGRDDFDDRSFTHETIRAETYLAWPVSATTRFEGGIGFRDHRLYDLDPAASPLLVREQTNGISAPYVRLGLKHKSLPDAEEGDDRWQNFGYSVRLDQYFWNIGTSDPLSDTRFEALMQFPIADRTRLLFGFDAGAVTGLNGNATRAIDRFYPGADGFRGFAPRGIGPRDGGDALGGNTFVRASIELQRDFGEVFKAPVLGGIFLESGGSWDLDDTLGGAIDDGWRRRSSVGLSVVFDIGKTPVSLYLATPIEHEPGDERQTFGISLSTQF